MLFNSFTFAIFLPIVFLIYWAIPHKWRWIVLFISSYYFYMSWNVKYVALILFTTFISYACALGLERADGPKKKKILIVSTMIASLGCLFFFKYFNFASESIANILNLFTLQVHPVTLNLLLPVGISFYTFQTLGYVIDVYRGDVKAEKNFGKYATFIAFFPQLVAGPIERTKNLMPQILEEHKFDYEKAASGLRLMAWGFFKKIVIADTLAVSVDTVYDSLRMYKGFPLLVVSVLFSIQIYCDFAGYSDIAIGTARLFGIDLMKNFDSPYFSTSVKDFWARWHISLSTWLRDYIYIPLGGNRVSKGRNAFNLMATFLISGLWHGANWTYVVWGGIHGFAQVVEKFLFKVKKKDKNQKPGGIKWWISVFVTFVFATFAWVFFRAETISDAFYVLGNMFQGITNPALYVSQITTYLGMDKLTLLGMIISVGLLTVFDYYSLTVDVLGKLKEKKKTVRWIVYVAFILFLIFNVPATSGQEFIYFQF
jgi:D-alanyl-lipoteichoic acid acyltransferase DltB (MBOAT superfamily)